MVFLHDATNSAQYAYQIRQLVAQRKQAASLPPKKRRQLYEELTKLREMAVADEVNVEDSTISAVPNNTRKIRVAIKNCWDIENGKPYKMVLTKEEWYLFGKPYQKDHNNRNQPLLINPFATWKLK